MGMRVVDGHGRAQPSLSGAGCWYHSLEQHLEGPVAAQDGTELHKCNPQRSVLSGHSPHCPQEKDLRTDFSSSVEILLFQ